MDFRKGKGDEESKKKQLFFILNLLYNHICMIAGYLFRSDIERWSNDEGLSERNQRGSCYCEDP